MTYSYPSTEYPSDILTTYSVTADAIRTIFAGASPHPIFSLLADHVNHSLYVARNFRQSKGVDQAIEDGVLAFRDQYSASDAIAFKNNLVYSPLTSWKCRAGTSWLADIYINSEDKNWTLSPTPIPEVPVEIEKIVIDAVEEELLSIGLLEFDDRAISDRMKELKELGVKHLRGLAKKATDKMERKIQDQLLEGGYREAFDKFISDVFVYPNAFLRGPFVKRVRKLTWNNNEVKAVDKDILFIERIDPFSVYPSPDSSNTQDGAYIITVRSLTSQALHDCIGLEGFSSFWINQVLSEYPEGYDDPSKKNPVKEDAEKRKDSKEEVGYTSKVVGAEVNYDCVVYNGRLSAQLLRSAGINIPEKNAVESEIWVVGNKVIRAVINPYATGYRPIYGTSFTKVPGAFWGQSLPTLLKDIQKEVNAAARSFVINMQYSSGPIFEIDSGRLVNPDDSKQITPHQVVLVTAEFNEGGRQAVRPIIIPSNSNELKTIQDRAFSLADDISGIPRYISGNADLSGAGRTLGGLSLVMGNAAKGIKRIISNVDKDVIEPMIRSYFMYNMLYDPDPGLKVDVEVIAKGSSGLLQRELAVARQADILNLLPSWMNLGILSVEGATVLVREYLESNGFSPDKILPDPQRQAALKNIADAVSSSVPSSQEGTPMPELDGRSIVPDQSLDQIPSDTQQI